MPADGGLNGRNCVRPSNTMHKRPEKKTGPNDQFPSRTEKHRRRELGFHKLTQNPT